MKRSLLVGIAQYPGRQPMVGCTNDVEDMQRVLGLYGFPPSEPLVNRSADAATILRRLRQEISALCDGDELVFYFSGHGVTYPVDGVDHEGLCGIDFAWNNRASVVIDDDVSAALSSVPSGGRVTMIIDACHSGGIQPSIAEVFVLAETPSFRIKTMPVPPQIAGEIARLAALGQTTSFQDTVAPVSCSVLLCACAPNEVAADFDFPDGRANGVMTRALAQHLAGVPAEDAIHTRDELRRTIAQWHFDKVQTVQLHGDRALFTTPLISSAGDGGG